MRVARRTGRTRSSCDSRPRIQRQEIRLDVNAVGRQTARDELGSRKGTERHIRTDAILPSPPERGGRRPWRRPPRSRDGCDGSRRGRRPAKQTGGRGTPRTRGRRERTARWGSRVDSCAASGPPRPLRPAPRSTPRVRSVGTCCGNGRSAGRVARKCDRSARYVAAVPDGISSEAHGVGPPAMALLSTV